MKQSSIGNKGVSKENVSEEKKSTPTAERRPDPVKIEKPDPSICPNCGAKRVQKKDIVDGEMRYPVWKCTKNCGR